MGTNQATMPGADRDDESGRYQTTYDDAVFIRAIKDEGGMATTREIQQRVESPYRTTHHRLNDLANRGLVDRREVGNSFLWSVSNDDSEREDLTRAVREAHSALERACDELESERCNQAELKRYIGDALETLDEVDNS